MFEFDWNCVYIDAYNCDFCNSFRDYEWTDISTIQNIFYDVPTEGKGEINTAIEIDFDTVSING